MWWLDSERRSTPTGTPPLPPRQRSDPNAPLTQPWINRHQTNRQPASKQPNKPVATKRPIVKCVSPLIDTLTQDQEAANRILSHLQSGHEAETERLLKDVSSLEISVRQSALMLESQQAIIEDKESLLQLAEEKAEALQCSVAEFDAEVHRLDAELQSQETAQLALQKHHQEQIDQCEYRAMFSEHRLAELATVIHHQIDQNRERDHKRVQTIAAQADELATLHGILNENESLLAEKDQKIDELMLLQDQLANAKKRAAAWQLETQRSHASRKALAEQMRQERTIAREELEQSNSQRKQLAERHAVLESNLESKDLEISELKQLHAQLAEAKKRTATWQLETQRSHASRRALAEQMRREKAVDEDAFRQSESQRRLLEKQEQVAQLRIQRLQSEMSQLEKQLRQASHGRSVDRRIRETEISEVQSLFQARMVQIDQLKAAVGLRDREILGLKDALNASQVELHSAWSCSEDAANQLQLRAAELKQARDNEERFVQIQSDQAETLQARIATLVSELDAAQETSRVDSESFERITAELEGVIELLGNDRDQFQGALDLAQQSNHMLLNEAAKSRAQLSGGRAKGTLLIEQYEGKLRQAIETIEALQAQTLPNHSRGNRAA